MRFVDAISEVCLLIYEGQAVYTINVLIIINMVLVRIQCHTSEGLKSCNFNM